MRHLRSSLLRLTLALAFLLLPVYGTISAQDEGERAKLLEEIKGLLKEEMWLERAFDAAVQSLPASQQILAREAISRIDRELVYDEVVKAGDAIYTTDELKAYYEYRSTDAGRSSLRKETQMNAKIYEILLSEMLRGQSNN